MNCQELSEHATEIARAGVMDAAARDGALAHAESCGACSALLERERALSAALRATAESFNDAAAPARVEATLLAAFRAGRDAASAPAAVHPFAPAATRARAQTFAPRFGRLARAAFAASAVAASLVLAFVVFKRAPQRAEPSAQTAAASSPATPQQSPAARAETNAQTPARPADEGSAAGEEGGRRLKNGAEGTRPARVERAGGGPNQKKALAGAALAFNIDGGRAVFAEGEPAAGAAETAGLRGEETALTDFVPLEAGANSAPLDGGQVVRVEAPRAALASLGLPVDPRRAGETVKADLLLSHDGTAHAIRFVR